MSDPVESLPPLSDIIRDNDLRATKSLGQNFLCDLNITRKIARIGNVEPTDHVIEVGPGPGGLTRGILLEGGHNVTAIEFDERAVRALQSLNDAAGDKLNIIHGDALKTDLMQFGENGTRKIIANLPYNIATPLLIGWLKQIHEHGKDAYQSITVMLQLEVAQRIEATFGTAQYGRLAVLCQWLCCARICYHVPPTAFVPAPKVMSAIISLQPIKRDDNIPFETMEKLTAMAFGQRRKMIRQTLKPYLHILNDLGIKETDRADNLTVKDFINIAKAISS